MPKGKPYAMTVVALLALVSSACFDETTNNYFAPSQVVQQAPAPNATPSPGTTPGAGVVRFVRIGEFGEVCAPGFGPPAEQVPRQVRVGCTSAITCTPLDAQGRELPHEIPPRLDAFGPVSGNQHVVVGTTNNLYNLDVYGDNPGVTTFVCRVEGVSSDPWQLTVVP